MAWIDSEGKIHRDGLPPHTPRQENNSFHRSAPPPTRWRILHSDRSYLITGILAIEFGFLGVHNFYAKYYKKGSIQLGVSLGATILFAGSVPTLSILAVISMWIWAIVDAVMIFKGDIDKDGEGDDFWRSWFIGLNNSEREYVKPYAYPHTTAWVITVIASIVWVFVIFATIYR